jgi:hypothetical protein
VQALLAQCKPELLVDWAEKERVGIVGPAGVRDKVSLDGYADF